MKSLEMKETEGGAGRAVCKDWLRGACERGDCRFAHETPAPRERVGLFSFCHDFQNKGCFRVNCRFVHCTYEEQEMFLRNGLFPPSSLPHPFISVQPFNMLPQPPTPAYRLYPPKELDGPSQPKFMRFDIDLQEMECPNCIAAEQNVKRVHENYNILLKKYNELKDKNSQLMSMNEFLLDQTNARDRDTSLTITSRASGPMNLATVSVTPVVSLSEVSLQPQQQCTIALDAATSRAQIITQAPQLLTHNSGALIVTSAGAHRLMQANSVPGAQAVVAVAPAQIVASPTLQHRLAHNLQLAAPPPPLHSTSAPQTISQPPAHLSIISQSLLPH